MRFVFPQREIRRERYREEIRIKIIVRKKERWCSPKPPSLCWGIYYWGMWYASESIRTLRKLRNTFSFVSALGSSSPLLDTGTTVLLGTFTFSLQYLQVDIWGRNTFWRCCLSEVMGPRRPELSLLITSSMTKKSPLSCSLDPSSNHFEIFFFPLHIMPLRYFSFQTLQLI